MQQHAYMQMLRAGAFAATAFEAVARLSVAFCVDLIIVVLTVMAVMYLHCIQAGEEVRNADVLRTSVDAVADGSFALPIKVDACGIKVVEARIHIHIDHPCELIVVRLCAFHRQTHTAEAEIALFAFKAGHVVSPI